MDVRRLIVKLLLNFCECLQIVIASGIVEDQCIGCHNMIKNILALRNVFSVHRETNLEHLPHEPAQLSQHNCNWNKITKRC